MAAPSDFELTGFVAKGSFGRVFTARQRGASSSHTIAVKIIELSGEPDLMREMMSEVERLRECRSQYVLEYINSFCNEGMQELWVVTEFCEGGSLLDAMRKQREPLKELQIAAAMAGMLQALDHLHRKLKPRMLHRDVKAANCLLTHRGGVRLADFGMAVQLGHSLSARTTAIGT